MKLILATANEDKVREIGEIIRHEQIQLVSMRSAGFEQDIIENGSSFAENALIKARAVFAHTGGYVLADDSGLSVDLLDGAPGIYSARFAGEQAGYPEKIQRLHELLRPWPPRQWQAAFICVMALIDPQGNERTFAGQCRGRIAAQPAGNGGFGYDPIFFVPDLGRTMAELEPAHKHRISHRGQALASVMQYLQEHVLA